jgi:hypothetical protein
LKSIAALLGFVLLAATLTAPAAAAAERADPTNVQISWKDGTFKFIHVTWEEAGPQPNAVFVRVVGKPDRYRIGYVGADAPNEFDMRSELLYSSNGIKEIGVVAGTAAGDLSQVAVSPACDRAVVAEVLHRRGNDTGGPGKGRHGDRTGLHRADATLHVLRIGHERVDDQREWRERLRPGE